MVLPSQSIPYIGYIAAMSSVISRMILELAARQPEKVRPHQERLEQIYLENDILFNLPVIDDLIDWLLSDHNVVAYLNFDMSFDSGMLPIRTARTERF